MNFRTRNLLLALCLLSFSLGVQSQDDASLHGDASLGGDVSLNVMTFNIRYNNPNDGEHAWPNRKLQVVNTITFHQAELVGMQEVLQNQLDDLETLLPGYSWIGVGRDDGERAGEFSPIFYRTEKFALLSSGTFWLSESPEIVASKSWDAALTRIATWARFTHLDSGKSFVFLNTHFDHRGEQARIESAKLIIERVRLLAEGSPVIVTGDFNVPPSSPAYATMTEHLRDSRLVSATPAYGPEATFSGFSVGSIVDGDRIDYIFVDETIEVLRHGALSGHIDGSYPSDHLPVIAEINFN